MAKVKLNGASVISGTIGGQVYSRNRGGAYIRQWVKPINPNTTAQSATRSLFANLSNNWRALTEAERTTWNVGSANFPKTDRIGETIVLSGQQLFMSFNRNQQSAGNVQVNTCPAPITVPTPVFAAVTLDITQFLVGFTPDPVNAGETLIVSCSHPVSSGVTFASKSWMKQVTTLPAASVSPDDIFDAYNVVFGVGSIQVGAKIFVNMHIIDRVTGISSATVQASYIVV